VETTIYRTGQMTVPSHQERLIHHWNEFDVRRPSGYVSRQEALFASPDLQGANYWLQDRSFYRTQVAVFNEVIVDSDRVRVYDVREYDSVGFDWVGVHGGKPTSEDIAHMENYWNTSMTLTDWINDVKTDPEGHWEVLLPVSEIIYSRILSHSEMEELYIANDMDELSIHDLKYIFKNNEIHLSHMTVPQ
jgi:hypothetical protein